MRTNRFRKYFAGFAGLALILAIGAFAGTYSNTTPIDAQDATSTNPPVQTLNPVTSTIPVSESGTVQAGGVSVTLFGVTSEWPDDLDIYLTSPSNTNVMLWSDAGGQNITARPDTPITNPTDVTFSDAALNSLPDESLITEGTYKPTNYSGNPDIFCDDRDPPGTFTSALSAFHDEPVQGNWVLTVVDDCTGNNSHIGGGWSLTVSGPTAVRIRGLSASKTGRGVLVRWTTGDETTALGYNVYRALAGKTVKVNRSLIRAKFSGAARGATYRVFDHAASRSGRPMYRLQMVNLSGATTWAGFVSLGRF